MTEEFAVYGMHCHNCERYVRLILMNLDGVSDVRASFPDERASVSFNPGRIGADAILDAIRDAGFEADTVDSVPPDTGSAPRGA